MLKKILLFLILFFSLSFSVFAESIKNYEVNIILQKDSSMIVEEIIDYDFGANFKHGIFRFIPLRFSVEGQEKNSGLMERKIEISELEIYRDGKKENIAEINKDDSNGNYFIKVGSEHKTFAGAHQYIIKYRVDGSLRYFEDYDEIYWNAIGLDWKVPIQNAIVNLSSENIKFDSSFCYEGGLKSSEKCNVYESESGVSFESSGILNSHEGLTIAASFKKGIVKKNEIWVWGKKSIWISIVAFLTLISGGLFVWGKSYLNKFKSNKPVIPIYYPYENYHPALTGFLIDKKFDVRDMTAGILSIAQKGYMKINRVEKKGILFGTNVDYVFELKKNISDVVDELDKMFLKLIFTKSKMDFSDFFSDDNFKNKEDFLKEIKLSDLSDRASDIQIQRQEISNWLKEYSEKNNFVEKISMKKIGIVLVFSFLMMMGVFFSGFFEFGMMFFIFYIIIFIFLGALSLRYTKKGWEIKNSLDGFKMFLEYTEKERIKFFNSPESNPQEFLDYLPYATAFGVENEWKKQFKNIAIPKPDWYSGKEPFIASAMMSDISKMSETINSTIATAATSGSGSGGGGFSGGGGGGGGGGSW